MKRKTRLSRRRERKGKGNDKMKGAACDTLILLYEGTEHGFHIGGLTITFLSDPGVSCPFYNLMATCYGSPIMNLGDRRIKGEGISSKV